MRSKISVLLLSLLGLSQLGMTAPNEEVQKQKWCDDIHQELKGLHWRISACKGIDWRFQEVSVKGRPLMVAEFGDPKSGNTTLIFSMVHSDEITPLYLGLQLAHWVKENQETLGGAHVVIAPLVNPDGFFGRPKTRVNARGVDVNRNFPTSDWPTRALTAWKKRFRSDPRRFPGEAPSSEPETRFQQTLIQRIRPQKILSIHAPLNFMDYDGPSASALALARFPKEYIQQCTKLRKQLKAVAGGFFPGSLGNYAGQELGIPTLTLELPSADPGKADGYWKKFQTGIRTMIEHRVLDLARR